MRNEAELPALAVALSSRLQLVLVLPLPPELLQALQQASPLVVVAAEWQWFSQPLAAAAAPCNKSPLPPPVLPPVLAEAEVVSASASVLEPVLALAFVGVQKQQHPLPLRCVPPPAPMHMPPPPL